MDDERRQPRPRAATLVRRREILDAAVDIFGAKGFSGGTLQDIADQVGMTHAGILHHFGSKDHLLLAVLEHRDRTDVADFEGQHMPDGIELFRHLVATAIANAERAGIVQAYAVLSAESGSGRPLRRRRIQATACLQVGWVLQRCVATARMAASPSMRPRAARIVDFQGRSSCGISHA